jgi:hypothetical protein
MLVVKQNIANCSFCEIELPIVFSNWKMKNEKLWNFTSKYDFVIQKWTIKLWKWHSYISDWTNVDFAGELKFNSNWDLIEFSNWSWHYLPSVLDKNILLDLLNKKWISTYNLNFIDRSNEF